MNEEVGFPGGANLVRYWKMTGTHGRASVSVPESPSTLELEWNGYRAPEGSALGAEFGEQFLVRFTLNGKPLLARERYVDTLVTDEGKEVHEMEYTSRDGVCATELVKALLAGQALEFEPAARGGHFFRASSLLACDFDGFENSQADRPHNPEAPVHEHPKLEEFSSVLYVDLDDGVVEVARSRLRDPHPQG